MTGKLQKALIIAVIVLISIFGVLFLINNQKPQDSLLALQQNKPPEIKGCVDLDRQAYNIPEAVFEQLPKPPKCFSSMIQAFNNSQFSDDFFFTQQFFLQPEFYPNFKEQGLSYWLNPNATHYGAIGYGAFPSEKEIKAKAGESYKARFFIHSSFGVRTFQGIRLEPEFENPENAEFVKVILDKESNEGFLLGPSFPKFDSEWAKAFNAEVIVSPAAPKKQIIIFLKAKNQSPEQALEWQKSRENYYNATDFVGERTAARLVIQIE